MASTSQRGRGQLPMPVTASGGTAGAATGCAARRGAAAAAGLRRGADRRGTLRACARPARPCRPGSCAAGPAGPRHQFVLRHAAPGRQVLVDRDLGRADLQQAARRQRVDVLADQQQQAVAAVEVAAVEGDVG
jgi:hypothetical protein